MQNQFVVLRVKRSYFEGKERDSDEEHQGALDLVIMLILDLNGGLH